MVNFIVPAPSGLLSSAFLAHRLFFASLAFFSVFDSDRGILESDFSLARHVSHIVPGTGAGLRHPFQSTVGWGAYSEAPVIA